VKGLIKSRKDLNFVQVSVAADYAERLRAADLRVTRPRIAVLYAVDTSPHSDTEMIIRAVHECLPDVSRQAVYDILNALTSAGLLRRVQPSGFVARYESRVGDNHHHMVCRSCGAIADVECAVGAAPCLTAPDTNGFHLDEAEVVYWGQCLDCFTPDASQAIGDRGPTSSLRHEIRFRNDTPPVPPCDALPAQSPTSAPEEWNSPSLPRTPLTTAQVGMGGPPADAVLISFDVTGAALTGYGRRNGDLLSLSGDGDAK
jgi:Fe2+ or Zn2+ uptake regulation protein